MSRRPITDQWPEVRRAAELGVPFTKLSESFHIKRKTIERRAERENWVTPQFIAARAAKMAENVGQGALSPSLPLQKRDADNNIPADLVIQTWDERASAVRQLAWHIGQSSLRGLDKTGIPVKDAGDAAKLIKMMREATGQFQDQPLVQMAVFNGANSGFDAETVQSDTVIMEDASEYETEM
jgi:hypothetical protein